MNPRKIPSSILFGVIGYFTSKFLIFNKVKKYEDNSYNKEIDKIVYNKYGIPSKQIRLSSESINLRLKKILIA